MSLAELLHVFGFTKSLAKKKAPELRRLLIAAGWRPGFSERTPHTTGTDHV